MNKLICGDCLDVLRGMDDNSVDAIVTDIPYGEVNRKSSGLRNLHKGVADVIDFSLEELLDALCRITKGSLYIFCGTEQVSTLRAGLVKRGLSTRLGIWEKTNPSPMNGDKLWLSGIECCVFGRFPNAVFNQHCKNTVWRFPVARDKAHPTPKPIKLMRYLIESSTNSGQVVLDPFMGSGSTGVACAELGRDFIGIEKDPGYFEIAKARIEAVKRA